jgi:predicted neutral ceramidase superfamily lipid hydrolase
VYQPAMVRGRGYDGRLLIVLSTIVFSRVNGNILTRNSTQRHPPLRPSLLLIIITTTIVVVLLLLLLLIIIIITIIITT